MKADQKVTIYTRSEFIGNIVRIEAKLIEHGRRQYAQYENAPFVKYVPKGKRNPRGLQGSFQPYILILEGWGHPEPASWLGDADDAGMSSSRYASHDDRWQSDFDAIINPHIEGGAVVVADYRYTAGSPAA